MKKAVTSTLVSAYQHIANGGVSYMLLCHEFENGRHEFLLDTYLSNHGIIYRSVMPMFATSAPILRALADELEKQALVDPSYLGHVDAELSTADLGDVYYRNQGGSVSQVDRATLFQVSSRLSRVSRRVRKMTAQLAIDCKAFLTSKEFDDYANEFPRSYHSAVKAARLDDAAPRKDWPDDWKSLGRFCQYFWEALPNSPHIRHGAFFKLCDFAEKWCFA